MRTSISRTVLELIASGAAGWALAAACEPGDAFRGTLAILPLVVAALRAVERHAGARRLRRGEGRIAAIVLGGLIILTLDRHRLGLVATDWFLAAGFLLLLAHRVARLVVGLRPTLGRRLPRRPAMAFFLLPLIVYLAIQPWSSSHRQPDGDEPFYLLLAHSLAYDFDLDLTNNYAGDWRRFMERSIEPQPGDPVGPTGELRSRHSFLLPLVLAPAYRLAGRHGAMIVMAFLTAALAWMVLRLARHYAPDRPGAALLAYAVFAFGPPLLLYSYQIWVEVPAALLLTLALDRLLDPRDGRRWGAGEVASFGLTLALLPVLKLRFVALALPLLVLAAWRARPGKTALLRVSGIVSAAVFGLLIFNAVRFGNPFKIFEWRDLDLSRFSPADFVHGAVGIFYDCGFGLFAAAPIWLLLLPALGLLVRRRSPLVTDIALVAVPYLVLITPRLEWYGGWSPTFRYPLVFLPLLALVLVPLFAARSRPVLRTLIATLGAVTLVLTVIWVVIPGWTYNLADGRSLLLDRAGIVLGADVARLFPSVVRPRAATWLWLMGSLLLIPVALWQGRQWRRSPPTPAWGVVALLLVVAAVPVISRGWPTRVVHVEDAFVIKHQGAVYPEPWVLQRPAYRGGWALAGASWLVAPVVPGGERVKIRLAVRRLTEKASGSLWIGAGETHLAYCPVGRAAEEWWQWHEVEIGPFDWPAGEPLVIHGSKIRGGPVVVDRAELEWQ